MAKNMGLTSSSSLPSEDGAGRTCTYCPGTVYDEAVSAVTSTDTDTHRPEGHAFSFDLTVPDDQTGSGPHPMNRDVVVGGAVVEEGEKTSATTKGDEGTEGTAKDRPTRRLVLKAVTEDAAVIEARRKNLMMGR